MLVVGAEREAQAYIDTPVIVSDFRVIEPGHIEQPDTVAYIEIQPYLLLQAVIQASTESKAEVERRVNAVVGIAVDVVAVFIPRANQEIEVGSQEDFWAKAVSIPSEKESGQQWSLDVVQVNFVGFVVDLCAKLGKQQLPAETEARFGAVIVETAYGQSGFPVRVRNIAAEISNRQSYQRTNGNVFLSLCPRATKYDCEQQKNAIFHLNMSLGASTPLSTNYMPNVPIAPGFA